MLYWVCSKLATEQGLLVVIFVGGRQEQLDKQCRLLDCYPTYANSLRAGDMLSCALPAILPNTSLLQGMATPAWRLLCLFVKFPEGCPVAQARDVAQRGASGCMPMGF